MTRPGTARLAAAAGSGVLLALARPPADLGLLSFIALVPLFVVWRDGGVKTRAALAFTAGVAYYAVVVSWAWYFGAIAIVPFVLVLAAYWALVGAGVGWLAQRGISSPWWIAAVWVLGEALLARAPFGGFSWGEVGYALHDFEPGRDIASIGGVALVSFLLVALNALLAELWVREWRSSRAALTRLAAGILGIVVLTSVIVVARPEPTPLEPFRVAILQGNDKNRELTAQEKADRYLPESHFGLAAQVQDPVDLIIFPESSMDKDPRLDQTLAQRLAAIAREHDAWVLTNAVTDAPDGRAVNLNVLYNPDGELVGTYAKRHLVPYGERVPFRGVLEKFIGALDRIPRDFAPGGEPGDFEIAGTDVATVICFESAFGYQVRPLVRDGANVVIVSTNNRSYRRSANSAQHLALAQMRAAETGRPVVQAAISGISALIDARGRVRARTELFDRTVLQGEVTATSGTTLYVRFGDWIVLGSLAALVTAIVWAVAARVVTRRRRSVDSSTAPDTEPALSPTGDRG